MRILRFIGVTLLVLIGLAAAGIVGIWALNPFAPPVVVADAGETGRRVTDSGLLANYYPGKGEGKRPGILLLGGSEGGIGPAMGRMAVSMQSAGFSVLNVSYYRAPGQSERLEMVPLETFDRALAWLKQQPEVDAERLAIVGGSKGAEAALIVATRHPELRAVVAGMPSSVAWQGLDWNFVNMMVNPPNGSWSLNGKPIPFLPYGQPESFEGGPMAVYVAGLKARDNHHEAIIKIELSGANVLLICGKQDSLWPACPMADQVKERADFAGGPDVTVLAYDNAGHGVMGEPVDPTNPNYQRLGTLGGTPEGNNAARADGWPKVLKHLEDALR